MPSSPPCDESLKMTVDVGYYASWSSYRPCHQIRPSMINAGMYTHLIFAFAIVSEDYKLIPANESDIELYKEFAKLKD